MFVLTLSFDQDNRIWIKKIQKEMEGTERKSRTTLSENTAPYFDSVEISISFSRKGLHFLM